MSVDYETPVANELHASPSRGPDYRFARSPVARGPSVSSLHLLRMGSDTRGGNQLQADRDHDTVEALRPRGP